MMTIQFVENLKCINFLIFLLYLPFHFIRFGSKIDEQNVSQHHSIFDSEKVSLIIIFLSLSLSSHPTHKQVVNNCNIKPQHHRILIVQRHHRIHRHVTTPQRHHRQRVKRQIRRAIRQQATTITTTTTTPREEQSHRTSR